MSFGVCDHTEVYCARRLSGIDTSLTPGGAGMSGNLDALYDAKLVKLVVVLDPW